jgi:hypothetical protein
MSDELCEQCQHLSKHLLVTTSEDVLDGGVRLCVEAGCECFSTWSVGDEPVKYVPDEQEIAELRRQVQQL